jgi:transcriptional regulator with XRE-family HTH domain
MAISAPKVHVSDEVKAQRRAGGAWLRSLRERAGLSQRMAADKLGYPFYSLISQIENGIGRVPSSRYREWAEVYGIEPKRFVKGILRHYDPHTYDILFRPKAPVAAPTSIVPDEMPTPDQPPAAEFLTDGEVIHLPTRRPVS